VKFGEDFVVFQAQKKAVVRDWTAPGRPGLMASSLRVP
jgi:hypothetical protein